MSNLLEAAAMAGTIIARVVRFKDAPDQDLFIADKIIHNGKYLIAPCTVHADNSVSFAGSLRAITYNELCDNCISVSSSTYTASLSTL